MVMMMVRAQRRQSARAAGVTICAEVRQAVAAVAAAVHVLDLFGGLIADDSVFFFWVGGRREHIFTLANVAPESNNLIRLLISTN